MMEQKLCAVGRSTDNPCPYPATESLPHRFPGEGPHLCAFHAATQPLMDESEDLGVSLSLVRSYLKDARDHAAAAPLVVALGRVEADFSERLALADKTLDDLWEAEGKLMRGQRAK